MNPPLHLVLSCTNRKHVPSADYPRLRDVRQTDAVARANAWIELVGGAAPGAPARELYAGEYWSVAMGLSELCGRHFRTQGWVISAGLGLVGLDDQVPAYAATLAAGHPDSVAIGSSASRDLRQKWWAALSTWNGPAGAAAPRRLADLKVSDGSTVIVCVGRTYADAVTTDLIELKAQMSDERLLLLSSGDAPPGLEGSWLSVPGQLRTRFGGSMSSTGPRVCRAVIERLASTGDLGVSAARELVAEWVQESAPLPLFERKRLSDDDVMGWIEDDSEAHPGASNRSAALRRLRESGVACEQGRFSRLFGLVVEATR